MYYPHFSFIGQNVSLFNDTLRNNLTYGLASVPEQVIRTAVKRARLEELVAGLAQGLDTAIGDRGVCLSGGERQRLAIARALLRPSSIFLFVLRITEPHALGLVFHAPDCQPHIACPFESQKNAALFPANEVFRIASYYLSRKPKLLLLP